MPTTQRFVQTNGLQLAYLDHHDSDSLETLILMPGLTANSHSFDGFIAAGLSQSARVLALDLRGRGLSDKPETGYSPDDHARDILGLLDALGLESVVMGGHSYGGLMSLYLAAHYPSRVKKLVVIDAGVMHPEVRKLIQPSIDRLGKPVDSWEAYLARVKQTPYYHDGFWDAALDSYYRADVQDLPDGRVMSRSTPGAIEQAVEQILTVDWRELMPQATQPALFLHATEGAGPAPTPPVMDDAGAEITRASLPDVRYHRMNGNHMTVLFGANAAAGARLIGDFIRE